MELFKPTFEILEQKPRAIAIPDDMEIGPRMVHDELLNSIYRQIELAGRTCYKSFDKMTSESAKKFTNAMIRSGHGAMLEHGTVYLTVSLLEPNNFADSRDIANETYVFTKKYEENKYSKVNRHNNIFYITTNLRVLVENDWMDDLQYLCEPTEYHERRVTVKFGCDRVTGESFLRHRAIDEDHPLVENVTREDEKDINSFARESTRYCNYSNKKKFGGNLNIVQPCWTYDTDIASHDNMDMMRKIFDEYCGQEDYTPTKLQAIDYWLASNKFTEYCYMKLIECGWQAQQARTILPMDIKSPLVMTAFISDWEHFFFLRCASDAHPQAQELAIPLKQEFIKHNYISE